VVETPRQKEIIEARKREFAFRQILEMRCYLARPTADALYFVE